MITCIEIRFRRGVRRVRQCLGVVVTISSAACAPSPEPAAHTVAYYREHSEVRHAKLVACGDDPGTLGRTADCVNALEASRIEGIGSQRDLPPLGLPTKPASKTESELRN
jgi:hypothetical protein